SQTAVSRITFRSLHDVPGTQQSRSRRGDDLTKILNQVPPNAKLHVQGPEESTGCKKRLGSNQKALDCRLVRPPSPQYQGSNPRPLKWPLLFPLSPQLPNHFAQKAA